MRHCSAVALDDSAAPGSSAPASTIFVCDPDASAFVIAAAAVAVALSSVSAWYISNILLPLFYNNCS